MTKHSSIVGGSTAGRILACPGSYQATVSLPPSAEVSSVYAEEGTFAHACMDMIMRHRMTHAPFDTFRFMRDDAMLLLGMHVHDREVTQAHIDTLILPAINALHDLENQYRGIGGFEIAAVEKSVSFPGVPGAHGTIDLILRSSDTVLHVDWKFGAGVPVKAIYYDEANGDLLNPQLMFYVTAARHSARHIYRGGDPQMVLAIIQPLTSTPLTHTTVTKRDLKVFREDVEYAVTVALSHNPPRQRGDHCRFAPCKATCPLFTGPLLEIPALRVTPPVAGQDGYGAYLSKAKYLADLAADYKAEIDKQLHQYLANGGSVPGWRLKAKAKQRQWIDDTIVEHALEDIGFDTKDIFQRKLVTFQQADATAKRLGVKIPDELRVAPETNETTICPTNDPAPVVTPVMADEQFRAALAALNPTAQITRR